MNYYLRMGVYILLLLLLLLLFVSVPARKVQLLQKNYTTILRAMVQLWVQ